LSFGFINLCPKYHTPDAALTAALQNNKGIQNERLKAEYQKQLIQTAANLPATNLTGDYGQINSNYNDNRLGIAELFQSPTVYAANANSILGNGNRPPSTCR